MDTSRTNREHLRVNRLADKGGDDVLKNSTVAERVGMMWQLAIDASAFKGESITQSRLPRHIVRFVKNKRAAGRPKDIADVAYLEADE